RLGRALVAAGQRAGGAGDGQGVQEVAHLAGRVGGGGQTQDVGEHGGGDAALGAHAGAVRQSDVGHVHAAVRQRVDDRPCAAGEVGLAVGLPVERHLATDRLGQHVVGRSEEHTYE